MKVEIVYEVPRTHASKWLIEGRYAVYLNPFSKRLQRVIDTKTNADITDSIKGCELIIVAYSAWHPR